MPKTIDYPRTTYLSAWEVAEVVDDTGGKCSVEASARKLNRKVSGSFKAILGSAVKFGLLTSEREMLTTTNLFRRIKHAYDKEEEKIYHREAFLHPPLFSHICRKFRNRELPVHMFDVMLVREFDVEEINAQNVARAFIEGARMVDIIDERNFIADIDQLTKASPRRDVASPEMGLNLFRAEQERLGGTRPDGVAPPSPPAPVPVAPPPIKAPVFTDDAVANLFGLESHPQTNDRVTSPGPEHIPEPVVVPIPRPYPGATPTPYADSRVTDTPTRSENQPSAAFIPTDNSPQPEAQQSGPAYTIRIHGPGIDTQLAVQEDTDLVIVQALLDKIRKHLQRGQ